MLKKRKQIKEINEKRDSVQRLGGLSNFIEQVAENAGDKDLRKEILKLHEAVESLPPSTDERAIKLDRVINEAVDTFHNSKIMHENIFGDSDAEMISEQYRKANLEIFSKFSPYLSEQVALRKAVTIKLSDKIFTAQQIKERERENDKAYSKFAEKAEVDESILKFTIRKLAIFHKKQILEQRIKILTKRYNATDSNSELEELEQDMSAIQDEIEQLNEHSIILMGEIANHRKIKGLLGDTDLDKFIKDEQYGQEKLLNIISQKTKEAKNLAAERRKRNAVFGEMMDDYKASKNPGYAPGPDGMKEAMGLNKNKYINDLRANRERARAEKKLEELRIEAETASTVEPPKGDKDEKR